MTIMMTDRTSRILETAIQGFIDTGEPVSSGWLFDEHDFGIRPAMIRRELELLSDEGYLEQPYHSAGRVPTDKGYEFFAKKIVSNESATVHGVENLLKFLERGAFADFLGEFSESFSLAGAVKSDKDTYKGGIESLVDGFEWETADEIKSVIRDFAALDRRMEKLTEKTFFSGAPTVFVGKKSPVTKSECLTVIFGGYDNGKEKTSLLAIGPKRMNYIKTINVFKKLSKNQKNGRSKK